jgi:hypothetical protein
VKNLTTKDYSFKTALYFTHGIEIENHLVSRKTGEVLVGEVLLAVWNSMFEGAAEFLRKIRKDKRTPKEIAKKITKVEVNEEIKRERRLKFVFVSYKIGKKPIRVNAFGPDPNIGQITWLLELVTPPCEYLEELEWWIDTLYSAALFGLSKIPDAALLPIGLNPTETRVRSGLTCGEHHHIGIPRQFRIPVYNMLRNFVPHLIGLSVCSPFMNTSPSGKVLMKKRNGKEQIIGRCIHSYRLTYNTGQMGPNIPTYLPALSSKSTRKDFAKSVKKSPPDDRMVDLFPFTDYNTIEARFFDANPWKENRLAIILLIQAMAQKARKLIENKEKIPKVASKSLYENRRKSVQYGLLAQFTTDDNLPEDFSKYYNYDITTGKKASKLMHSIKSLLVYIRDELEGFDSDQINFLLIPVLGSVEYDSPLSVVEYLLALYNKSGENISFLEDLYYKEGMGYPLVVDGDFSSLEIKEIDKKGDITPRETSLQEFLKKDLAKKKISIPIPTKKRKKKKRVKKPVIIKKVTPRKKPTRKEKEKEVKIPTIEVQKPSIPSKTIKKPTKVSKKAPAIKVKEIEPETVISAFEETEELEVFSPAIEIEPKYQKIESKIANVMRTRRTEIEEKRREFFRLHLEKERVPFKPYPKKVTADFPALVSGSEVFGFIELKFGDIKKTMYKFQNNPITFIFKAKGKEIVETKVNTTIDIANLERRGICRIPCSFNVGDLQGLLNVSVEAITATNESLIPSKFGFKVSRNDDILIKPEEFYITSNYGAVECIYKATNESNRSEKGELEVLLLTQSQNDPIPIYFTKFNLNPGKSLELARSIDLSIDLQHATFYIVSRVTMGRFTKNRTFKTIRVPAIQEFAIDWNFVVGPRVRYNLREGVEPKKQYEVDFVFHFLKALPPVSITIFVNTLPNGETKRLTSVRIKRAIDEGDEFAVSNIKFKTPKNCGYIYFDVEIRTEKGLIPLNLITEPVGVHSKGEKSYTYEEKYDLKL